MYDIEKDIKFLPSKKLAELLLELPEGSLISTNAVGNLLVYKDEIPIAFIDFVEDGDIEFFS